MYVSLDAPDRETYMAVCRPLGDYWDRVQESLRFSVPDGPQSG